MVNLRILTENDFDTFEKLELDTFPDDPMFQDSFLITVGSDGFFGLFDNKNNLIGYLYCRIYGDYSHLHRIGILSSERGKGYGSLLFEKAINYFGEHNSPHFHLFVKSNNIIAINLYKKWSKNVV